MTTLEQEIPDGFIELNIGNYTEDDVSQLNDWAVAAHQSLQKLIAGRDALKSQLAQRGEPVLWVLRDVEGGSLRDFSSYYKADQFYIENRSKMINPELLCCYAAPPAHQTPVPDDVYKAAISFRDNGYRGPLPLARKVFDWVAAHGITTPQEPK